MSHLVLSRLAKLFVTCTLLGCAAAFAAPVVEIAIENHQFIPAVVAVPAHTKVKLLIHNRDSSAEEFESFELNREKVILGNSKTIIFIGPLAPGDYPFFGEFNPSSAQGVVRAADSSAEQPQ